MLSSVTDEFVAEYETCTWRRSDAAAEIPAATTVAPDTSAAEAEEIARGFLDAYTAYDADGR